MTSHLTNLITISLKASEIQVPVLFSQIPGESIQLHCTVAGRRGVAWYRDGEPLLLDRERFSASGGRLVIRGAGKNDVGSYGCADALAGRQTIVTHVVRVVTAIRIDPIPLTVGVHPGDPLRIECRVHGAPPPRVTWSLNDGRHRTGSLLSLDNATLSDSGSYACHATHERCEQFVAERKVKVNVFESTIRTNEDYPGTGLTLRPGAASLRLACDYPSDREAPIRWYKAGEDVALSTSGRYVINPDDMSLMIRRPSKEDVANYTCVAYGSIINESAVIMVGLKVDIHPERTRTYVQGIWGFLRCAVSGVPVPNVRWYRNGQELRVLKSRRFYYESHSGAFGDTVVIRKMQRDDNATYTCIADNGHSQERMSFNVSVIGRYSAVIPFLLVCLEVVFLCNYVYRLEKDREESIGVTSVRKAEPISPREVEDGYRSVPLTGGTVASPKTITKADVNRLIELVETPEGRKLDVDRDRLLDHGPPKVQQERIPIIQPMATARKIGKLLPKGEAQLGPSQEIGDEQIPSNLKATEKAHEGEAASEYVDVGLRSIDDIVRPLAVAEKPIIPCHKPVVLRAAGSGIEGAEDKLHMEAGYLPREQEEFIGGWIPPEVVGFQRDRDGADLQDEFVGEVPFQSGRIPRTLEREVEAVSLQGGADDFGAKKGGISMKPPSETRTGTLSPKKGKKKGKKKVTAETGIFHFGDEGIEASLLDDGALKAGPIVEALPDQQSAIPVQEGKIKAVEIPKIVSQVSEGQESLEVVFPLKGLLQEDVATNFFPEHQEIASPSKKKEKKKSKKSSNKDRGPKFADDTAVPTGTESFSIEPYDESRGRLDEFSFRPVLSRDGEVFPLSEASPANVPEAGPIHEMEGVKESAKEIVMSDVGSAPPVVQQATNKTNITAKNQNMTAEFRGGPFMHKGRKSGRSELGGDIDLDEEISASVEPSETMLSTVQDKGLTAASDDLLDEIGLDIDSELTKEDQAELVTQDSHKDVFPRPIEGVNKVALQGSHEPFLAQRFDSRADKKAERPFVSAPLVSSHALEDIPRHPVEASKVSRVTPKELYGYLRSPSVKSTRDTNERVEQPVADASVVSSLELEEHVSRHPVEDSNEVSEVTPKKLREHLPSSDVKSPRKPKEYVEQPVVSVPVVLSQVVEEDVTHHAVEGLTQVSEVTPKELREPLPSSVRSTRKPKKDAEDRVVNAPETPLVKVQEEKRRLETAFPSSVRASSFPDDDELSQETSRLSEQNIIIPLSNVSDDVVSRDLPKHLVETTRAIHESDPFSVSEASAVSEQPSSFVTVDTLPESAADVMKTTILLGPVSEEGLPISDVSMGQESRGDLEPKKSYLRHIPTSKSSVGQVTRSSTPLMSEFDRSQSEEEASVWTWKEKTDANLEKALGKPRFYKVDRDKMAGASKLSKEQGSSVPCDSSGATGDESFTDASVKGETVAANHRDETRSFIEISEQGVSIAAADSAEIMAATVDDVSASTGTAGTTSDQLKYALPSHGYSDIPVSTSISERQTEGERVSVSELVLSVASETKTSPADDTPTPSSSQVGGAVEGSQKQNYHYLTIHPFEFSIPDDDLKKEDADMRYLTIHPFEFAIPDTPEGEVCSPGRLKVHFQALLDKERGHREPSLRRRRKSVHDRRGYKKRRRGKGASADSRTSEAPTETESEQKDGSQQGRSDESVSPTETENDNSEFMSSSTAEASVLSAEASDLSAGESSTSKNSSVKVEVSATRGNKRGSARKGAKERQHDQKD